MPYEWDENKSEQNQRNRGFGFEIVEDFDWGFALGPEIQFVEGEEREMWIGPIGGLLYTIVITERGDNTRVISLRVAIKPEIAQWRKEYQND